MPTDSAPTLSLEDDGISITADKIITPAGDFEIDNIQRVERKFKRPTWGPLFLAALGTLNLTIGFRSGFWLDFAAAGIMLGGGIFWWTRGSRHVLVLDTGQKQVLAWYTRQDDKLQQVIELLRRRIGQK